ncbi:MAG: glutamine synthetase [Halobacteriovoraceae bacterium]|nr:glutamine synthetase [Halobacteriovoraceae bacterium]MBT5095604.1 glutamine synthetase [Halobacteriovoraceae bacterium]
MTNDQIIEEIKNYPGKKVKVAVTDIDGILRGKVMHVDKFLSSLEGGFGFCNVVFGWDSADVCYDNVEYTGWHTGYPDAEARLDLSTYRKVPWDGDIPLVLADFRDKKDHALELCPRNLLKKIRKSAADMGYSATFSQEFEWFNFSENSDDLHDKHFMEPEPITRGMFGYSLLRSSQRSEYFNDLYDLLAKFGVPIEGFHTETGPGVYECALLYSEILEAADRAVLFKAGVKEIASMHGVVPTFMAKWSDDYPGCSGHIHQSLWKDGSNVFCEPKDADGMSEIMKSYLAGLLHCLPHVLPLLAPTVNSFKRLVEGAWAPTTITWGIENRTCAVRAIPGSEKSTRIEMRVPGSDTNPYLAMSAVLASGLYGVKNKLKLEIPRVQGNGYAMKDHGVLPANLWESTQVFKNSKISNELFGEKFVKHFAATREWEWRQYSKTITDWERKRYFEII